MIKLLVNLDKKDDLSLNYRIILFHIRNELQTSTNEIEIGIIDVPEEETKIRTVKKKR
jgi:hypothetical protein